MIKAILRISILYLININMDPQPIQEIITEEQNKK